MGRLSPGLNPGWGNDRGRNCFRCSRACSSRLRFLGLGRRRLLTLFLFLELCSLPCNQLGLLPRFLLTQRLLCGIYYRGRSGCGNGRDGGRNRLGRPDFSWHRVAKITFYHYTLLAYLHLNTARFPGAIRFLDFGSLPARQADLAFFVLGAMNFAQVIEKLGFVLLGQTIRSQMLADTSSLKLLQQYCRKHSQFISELFYTHLRH